MNKIVLASILFLLVSSCAGKNEFQTFTIKNPEKLIAKYKVSNDNSSLNATFNSNLISKPITNTNTNPTNVGGVELSAPLIDRVFNRMKDIYKKVGEEQANEILNSGYDLGVLNNPSFFWQLPFGEIKISVRRQVDPDVFHETRYIVTDELIISIDAQKLLTNLKNEDIIEIPDHFFGLYAGIEFRRVYRFSHFAENFVEGLTNNYEYLFFPFLYFQTQKFNELDEYQFLERTDQLTAEVGGALNYQVPIASGISLSAQAAFMYGYENLTKVSLQMVGKDDEKVDGIQAKVNVSYEREKKASTALSTQLQVEFLKLLKLTLLQYEYDHSDTSSQKIDLSFRNEDLQGEHNQPVLRELDKVFLGASFNDTFFGPYKVKEETRIKQNLGSKYTVLFWKGTNEKETERVQTYQDGHLKTFYKHTFSKTLCSQTFWQMILPKLFLQIFNVGAINQYKELDRRIYHLEYQSEVDLLNNNGSLEYRDEEKLFASFSLQYFVKTFKSATHRKIKMTSLLRSYAYVDSRINSWIEDSELVPPMDLNLKTSITQTGLENFNAKTVDQVFSDILWICNNESKLKSKTVFSSSQIKDELQICRKHLENAYLSYHEKVLETNDQSLPIVDFKQLLEQFAKYFSSKSDIEKVFGKENVFIYGKFSSMTKAGKSFVHNFKHGELKSLGVIKDSNINRSKSEISESSVLDAQQDE